MDAYYYVQVVLANPAQKVVDLGVLRVCDKPEVREDEKQVEMKVPVVNQSPIPITLSVSLSPISSQLQDDKDRLTVEILDEKELKSKEVSKRREKRRREIKIKKDKSSGDLVSKDKELKEITLEPEKTGYVIVKLSLLSRISQFQEEVS